MPRVRGWMLGVLLCCAAGVASGEDLPDARLREAQAVFDAAGTAWDAGLYAEAMEKGEHALALREAVLGGAHPDVATCLDWLGAHHLLRGNPVGAEPLLQRALTLREAALGGDSPEVARTLNTLGDLYVALTLLERAEPLYVRALAIREAALGKEHLEVAQTLDALAHLSEARSQDGRARTLYTRALAIREAALGKHHPLVAETLQGLAWVDRQQGSYARARACLTRALAIREAALGRGNPLVANSLVALASLFRAQGLYSQAEPLYARALTIREAALGKNPPDVADALDSLAFLYADMGWNGRAEPVFTRALAVREAALGKDHPLVAGTLFILGFICVEQGLYGRAEPLLQRALAIQEATLGGNHTYVADSLHILGNLYVAQGLYAGAEPLYARSLAIDEAIFGKDHPYVALALNALGSLYVAQGAYARAEPLLQRALTIAEAARGKNHPYVVDSLGLLARLHVAQGAYARAEPLLQRALATREATLGRRHPLVADALNNLADFYSAQGMYDRARPLYERALTLWEVALGKDHPSVAGALTHLAVAHLAQHRLDKALPLFTRAFAMSERRLRQEALGFSEARLASFLQLLRADEERLYALLHAHPEDARIRRLALGAALLFKGRSVEESADISRTIYRGLGAHDRDAFERLRGQRTRLAELSLQGPGSLPAPVYHQRLEAFSGQAASLEADLARRSAPLRSLTALPGPEEIVDRVAQALPTDGALVEFIAYEDRPLLARPGVPESQHTGEMRYLALVLFPDATLRFQDLGPAAAMDGAISRLRDALANRDAAFQAPAQALYQLAFQPLLPLLGKAHRLFLSTDGQLALVPFAALYDGRQFLVDAFDFTYVPSGRSLLPHPEEGVSPGSVVVLADPDFRAAPGQALPPSEAGTSVLATRSLPDEPFFSTLRANLESRAWAPTPLPGTRQEAEAIQHLLPQAQLFLGADATKARLLHLPPPGVLHLATHGFFLEDTPDSQGSRAVVHFGALGEDTRAPSLPDPLLRSGLVLAGARASESSGTASSPDATLVTALELAGLDLWGTQLVVLSACDTGRGDVKLGQGVYGLRRAFLVAGAETVVMSLWKVNDATTRTLMEAYYRHLLAGEGRATALREAMRELRQSQPHPHYWAPFIAMGSDAPLRLSASGAREARLP